MNKSNLKTYKIRIFDYNFNQLRGGFQIQFNQDSTYQELKNHIIEKFPDILNKDFILSVNGYNPQLNSKIHKSTELITMIQENNEPVIDTNKLPMNDDNINDEEINESSSDDGYGTLLGDLLKQGKNDNLGKKRERLNSFEEQDNLIKFNEDFEIISDFAPTNNELYNIFFNAEPLLYNTKKRIKRIINPEKIIKQNNLQRNFLDIEYLTVQSIKDDEIIYNEEKNYTQDEEIIRRKVIDEVNKDIIQKDFLNEYYKEETKKEAIEEIKEVTKEEEISEDNIIKEEEISENNIIKEEEINEDNIIKEEISEVNNKITKKENIIKKNNKSLIKYNLDNHKFNIKQILLEFYNNTSFPTFEERIKYAEIINYLSHYQPERKQKKINFVFDLDNTLIHGILLNNKKNLKLNTDNYYINENLEIKDAVFLFFFHIRNGIEELFEEIKDIGNLYIYTLAVLPYALKIKNKIEQLCNITFIRMNCNEGSTKLKFLENLDINIDKTLVLDDSPNVWNGDPKVFNVIPSKCYYNETIMNNAKQSYTNEVRSNITNEFRRYFFYNIVEEGNDWLDNKLEKGYLESDTQKYYYIETENSKKNQLEYIGKVYKTVYNILEFGDYRAMVAVKMIKTILFAGMIFDLDYYKGNDIVYNILKKMIFTCGGEEYKKNSNIRNNAEFICICNKNLLQQVNKKYIMEKSNTYNQFYIVDESYVFDCNFCITKFSPLEYQLNPS